VLSAPLIVGVGYMFGFPSINSYEIALVLIASIFLLLAVGHYFMACTPRPPAPRPIATDSQTAVVRLFGQAAKPTTSAG
jgi:hypothetical protein